MSQADPAFGMSDDELASAPTVFAPGLLEDRRWLVSGSGSGLGKATAWLVDASERG